MRMHFLIHDDLAIHGVNDLLGQLDGAQLHLDLLLSDLHVAVLNVVGSHDLPNLVGQLSRQVPRHLSCGKNDVGRLTTGCLRVHTLAHVMLLLALILHDSAPLGCLLINGELNIAVDHGACQALLMPCEVLLRAEAGFGLLGSLWVPNVLDVPEFVFFGCVREFDTIVH